MKAANTLFFILLTFITQAQEINNKIKLIDSIINSKINKEDPGLMVGIVKDGVIIYEKYRGLANLQHQVKINKKTRSNIASTAKQFTALMILQLASENKLSLEDDIRNFFPDFYKNVEQHIKVRHLLNHTSGIRDYVELMSLQGKVWWKQVGLDNNDIIDLIAKQQDLGFKPGSQYSYSNSGYVLLAKIIEKVSNEKFTDYSQKFFKALGMNETSFVKRYMEVIPNRSEPYSDWGYGEWFHTPTVTKTAGEGFLFTTLKDQLIYEQLLQNANKEHNTLLVKSQQSILNSEITMYGLGLKLNKRLNRPAVHHDGVTYSYHSQTIRFPEEKLSIFIMSNNGNIRSDFIADEIATILLPKIDQIEAYNTQYYKSLEEEKSVQIFGQYYSQNGHLTRIVEEDGKTFLRQGKSLRLELIPETKNRYHFTSNAKEKIIFYENEMILFNTLAEAKLYKRVRVLPASLSDLESFAGKYYNSELKIGFELRLTNKKELEFLFSNNDDTEAVQVFNKNEMLAGDKYVLKIKRDSFNKITEILMDYDRANSMSFKKKTNLIFQPKIKTGNGFIQVTTLESKEGDSSDILLTKNYENGNEIWSKQFGGSGYDRASSIIDTKEGYLIIGSTSSFGKGNYDMFVIKTDKQGEKIWQNTYGKFYNDYGYMAEITANGYQIKGTTQKCDSNTDINRTCITNAWFVEIDKKGKEISSGLLESLP